MKINTIRFVTSAHIPSQYPKYTLPEFAFTGRSNVGKSSLINTLLGRKNIAKTGSKPGVTQTINFFCINEKMSFADCPGFGYAKVSHNKRLEFIEMIHSYIISRPNLKLLFLLIDIRREPDENEQAIITKALNNNINVMILATKCDKVSKNEINNGISRICTSLNINTEYVVPTSAKTGLGKNIILAMIQEYCK
ncbi:MAG TPA: ribosome biogenesis GTP-binding protein YihA/YsxC [Spirochaetota bacterium]|nr:ribosome biogenesis GTP-binding protein YihA/YsxC [Spirochaetota bacterium]